jgi:putative oxidoreductase
VDDPAVADLGLLALRVTLGGIYVVHGARKLGWRNPGGFAGFRASIARRGYRPAPVWAAAAVGAEIGGGLLAILGLLTPAAGALLVGQGVTILALVRHKGFWHDQGGTEYPLLLTVAAVAVAAAGAGALSLDAALGLAYDPVVGLGLAGLAAVVGALAGLLTRRPLATPPA